MNSILLAILIVFTDGSTLVQTIEMPTMEVCEVVKSRVVIQTDSTVVKGIHGQCVKATNA